MNQLPYTHQDFGLGPLMFYYEVTTACDLVCKHCRASAQEKPHPEELSTAAAKALLDQAAGFPRPPNVVLTGGDPLKRADLLELIRHAVGRGLHVALTPSATPLATPLAFQRVREPACGRWASASTAQRPPRTTPSAAGKEVSSARWACWPTPGELELAVQVNTTITRRNVDQVDRMAELLARQGIAMWSVFFLVPVGRGVEEERIRPEEYEAVFARFGITPGISRTRSRRPRPRIIGDSCSSTAATRWPGPAAAAAAVRGTAIAARWASATARA